MNSIRQHRLSGSETDAIGDDSTLPLVVDLDGTLTYTDTLHELAIALVRNHFLYLFLLPIWLWQGKTVLKSKVAARVDFNFSTLPFNKSLLEWLNEQKLKGRKLLLCTAADQRIANSVAQHLGIFDEVIATSTSLNLKGENKANFLVERYGKFGFDYVGNSSADYDVWAYSKNCVVVNASKSVLGRAESQFNVIRTFPQKNPGWLKWIKVIRAHQYVKNLLIFVPLLAAHQSSNSESLVTLIAAFTAFSLCASSVYIMNDLLDLPSDRDHPRKKERPFASGAVPIWRGILIAPLLLAISLLIGFTVSSGFLIWLLIYILITSAYSLFLKRLVLVDCLVLASLYTLRIVAGAAAVNIVMSFWLLAFSIFVFLSLAYVKRYAELRIHIDKTDHRTHGRGYISTDAQLVQILGIVSGYLSTLVLALYLQSENIANLYTNQEILWATIPLLIYWISWVWMSAHRGNMNDDPIIFALKDKGSISVGLLLLTIIILAA